LKAIWCVRLKVLLRIIAHFTLYLQVPMQAAEESRQRALAAERAASAALVEAEEELQRLVRDHRPGSPTVDDAVTKLANRQDEYDAACEATFRAETSCHDQHGDDILYDRHLRSDDHKARIKAARCPITAVSLQQGSSAAEAPNVSDAHGDQAETQGSQGDEAKAAGDQGTGQATAGDDSSSASEAAADRSIQQAQSPPTSEYIPSDLESSASE
jgi:hypothetical protein